MSPKEPSTFEFYGETLAYTHAYQPIVNLTEQTVFAYESLVRGPEGQPPAHIFSEIPRSSRVQFEQQNRLASIQRALALSNERFRLSLNFSTGCLLDGAAVRQQAFQALRDSGISFCNLVVEITESDIIHGVVGLSDAIYALRAEGATIAIDDFGAGYAGMNSLIEINPDIIKLDMFLVRGVEQSGTRQAAVRALCGLAEDLGIDLIAEGVETRAELDFLRNLGIELFQGFYLAKPGLCEFPQINWPD